MRHIDHILAKVHPMHVGNYALCVHTCANGVKQSRRHRARSTANIKHLQTTGAALPCLEVPVEQLLECTARVRGEFYAKRSVVLARRNAPILGNVVLSLGLREGGLGQKM